MNDSDATSAVSASIFKNMSPADKWAQVMNLRKAAWDIKAAFVRSENPDWTEKQVQDAVKKIFLYATT